MVKLRFWRLLGRGTTMPSHLFSFCCWSLRRAKVPRQGEPLLDVPVPNILLKSVQ